MDPELVDRLRIDLGAAEYRASRVRALLGPDADAARLRGVFAPARRALEARGASPLAALVRLLLLGEPVDSREVSLALPGLGADGAEALGLIVPAADGCWTAGLSLNPVELADAITDAPIEWWILSDLDDQLRRGPARPDHVMGVGGATRSLVAQAPPRASRRSLDLGTGCGIVALHLARRGPVVATDISERALRLARANARLNGAEELIEFRLGDLLEPVADETFDLVLSNPPFVISPRDGAAPVYEYRDGGLSGDALAERVVTETPAVLTAGGTLICLANWETPWGGNGLERVQGWVAAAAASSGPLDAWIVERDRVAPSQYAETWARDGGARPGTPAFETMLDAWLEDFAGRSVVSIGLGSIRVRRAASGSDTVVHADQAVGAYAAEALGRGLDAAFAAGVAASRMDDAAVLGARWILDAAVSEEREHAPGEEAPRAIALTTDRPIARRVAADPLLAAAVGACDGDLSLVQIADALAQLLEVDAGAAREALVAGARELAWLGMLRPSDR